MYSLTGLLWTSSGGAQDSFTVLEEKDITSGLPGVLGTSAMEQSSYKYLITEVFSFAKTFCNPI